MSYKTLFFAALASILSFGAVAADYDVELAASYAKLFAPAKGAKAGKALHLIPPAKFIEIVHSGKPMATLDVRTPGETKVFGMTLPGSLRISADELFQPANLQLIPRDRMVVVLCQAGVRATAMGTALRHVGFDNVYVLKGGFKGLSGALNCKVANPPPKTTAN